MPSHRRQDIFTFNKHICLFLSLFVIRRWIIIHCRSQWPLDQRRGSASSRLLWLWVRIPSWEWIFVCCECCVLSGWGLYFGVITGPDESYRVYCDWIWSWIINIEEALDHWGYCAVVKIIWFTVPWIHFRTRILDTELSVACLGFGTYNADSLA